MDIKEITLLGQNVNSYMKSENEKNNFDYNNTIINITKDDIINLDTGKLSEKLDEKKIK